MSSEFTTSKTDLIKVYPSSNIYRRVWIRIKDGFDDDKEASTELSIWDCDILIAILQRARKALSERD